MLAALFPQFASRLIRNGATFGGNLGTGSPIGDSPPALLALDAAVVLADADGERAVALADYFTGYRKSVRRPDELIRAIRIPLPLAGLTAFHKIAKRRFDDISSVAIGFALDVHDGVVRTARIGLGGVAATPIRGTETEAALEGRPWSADVVDQAAQVLARAGTPIDDQRASSKYRAAMLGQSLRKLYADNPRPGETSMSALSERPERPEVGNAIPHESAALHVTGTALYTDDLVQRTKDILHAWPVQVPHAHARVTALRTEPALAIPGVVRVLTAADVPGVNDAGVKHDEPLFPDEIMFFGHAVCYVLAETAEAARLGAAAVEVDVEPLPSYITVTEAIAAQSFQGAQPQVGRGDIDAGFAQAAHVFSGVFEFSGQEHFYLETHAALALVDENEQIFVQSSTQHPSETQEIVAHVLGRHSNEVTVQCLRMGGGFGGKEMQPHGFAAVAALGRDAHRPAGAAAAEPHPGPHDVGQAARFPLRLAGRASTPTVTSSRWTPRSPPTAAGASTCPSRCWLARCATSTTRTGSRTSACTGASRRPTRPRNTAFRGFGGPQGMFVIEDILGRCAPLLGIDAGELRRRNFYSAGQSTPYGQPVRHPERLAAIWDELASARTSPRGRPRSRSSTAHTRTSSARSR